MVPRKSFANFLHCVSGAKNESMISNQILSWEGDAGEEDFCTQVCSIFYGLSPPPVESNSLGSSGVCVRFIATQKWMTSEEGPFLLGWSILIGGNLPKRGSWGRCTHFCFLQESYIVSRCKSPTLFLGSTDCLDILLLVRLPVYRAARTLHRT
jgi:hypothetical protein